MGLFLYPCLYGVGYMASSVLYGVGYMASSVLGFNPTSQLVDAYRAARNRGAL